jgi:triosephosphate isomerase (TIM)
LPTHLPLFGLQAVFSKQSGAFTAAISPAMLKSMGVNWVLAGHSERRSLFKEDDDNINAQVRLLIANDMNVVLCIGETAQEYEKKLVQAVCEVQLKKGLAGVTAEEMKMVTIAYEPVWAIGTGKVATPEIAQDVHVLCRDILRDMYGSAVAESTRILYGGSVNAESVDGLMAKPDIDGTLVGGASLNASGFGRIINFVQEPRKVADRWKSWVLS